MGWEDGTPPPHRSHRDFKERRVVLAVAHPDPWASASSYLSSQSLRRFSLQPSCHLAVVPLSSFSLLSRHPLSRRSPLPRSATAPSPADPLLSQLLPPFGATLPSSRHIWPLEFIELSSRKGRLF